MTKETEVSTGARSRPLRSTFPSARKGSQHSDARREKEDADEDDVEDSSGKQLAFNRSFPASSNDSFSPFLARTLLENFALENARPKSLLRTPARLRSGASSLKLSTVSTSKTPELESTLSPKYSDLLRPDK